MNERRVSEMGRNESAGTPARSSASAQGGVVHAFVEMGELRRMMGCLAAIEMLRFILETDPALNA